jgi:hypothetical protein
MVIYLGTNSPPVVVKSSECLLSKYGVNQTALGSNTTEVISKTQKCESDPLN